MKDFFHGYRLDDIAQSTIDRVVAVELKENSADIFLRNGDNVEKRKMPFEPFLLLSAPTFLDGFDGKFSISKLSGSETFSFLAKFADVKIYEKALKHLKQVTGVSPSSPSSPYRVFSDFDQQFLSMNRIRLFRGMNFSEIRRMQIDIETLITEGYEFPNAERDSDAITLISLSDNTGWEKSLLLNHPYSEKQLLEEFVKTVIERDPDVIEGHNIFRFDLPYIETRAKKFKVRLTLGRDGSILNSHPSRITMAERTISYKKYEIYGRHIIDSYHLVQLYDVSHRDLEEYGLKSVARHFGVASPDRVYLEGDEIFETFKKDPKKLVKYGLDDVRETKAICEILSPSYFYQTQLIPYSYQSCVSRGNATRIDALLVAAYLTAGTALPSPEQERTFAGALTEAFHSGVFENVWHCDVRSLYPSIILAEKWTPARDTLGIFPKFLAKLREFRLLAKDAEKKAKTNAERDFHNALQTSFKILINSFYGYLGFPQGTFNDYKMAEAVTARGRQILSSMVEFLEKNGAKVIEIDTDGIYFQPPPGEKNMEDMQKLLQASLPKGIEVEFDESYVSMFCYKSKNYALMKANGEISITGAALKSRGLEPFQRDYISELVRLMLRKDFHALQELYEKYCNAIKSRSLPLAKFAKSETLSDSLDSYRRKLADGTAKRSAAYELAIASGRDYRQGDQVSFYVTGNKKNVSVVGNSKLLHSAKPDERDENIPYYLAKLDELHAKFSALAEFASPKNGKEMTELGFEV